MSKKNKRLISYLLAVSLVVLVAFLYIHNGGATPREDNVKEIDLAVSEISALKQNEIEGTLVYINSNSLFHLNLATSENKKIVNDVGGTTSPSSENGTFFSLDKQEVYLVNRIGETQETTFDIITQSYVDNAISNVNTLVTSVNELNLLQAIIQEKIEDFE